MFDKRSKYLDVFEDTMEQTYKDLKKTGIIPPELKGYIDGYMRAGRILGLVSHDQLKVIIDKASDKVFGMDVNVWLAKRKPATLSEDELDIPTIIRQGKEVIIDD